MATKIGMINSYTVDSGYTVDGGGEFASVYYSAFVPALSEVAVVGYSPLVFRPDAVAVPASEHFEEDMRSITSLWIPGGDNPYLTDNEGNFWERHKKGRTIQLNQCHLIHVRNYTGTDRMIHFSLWGPFTPLTPHQ